METTYEFILRAKKTQCWEGCMSLFPRANTLERYFHVYTLALQLEPDKKRGYQKRLLKNHVIVRLLGACDEALLKKSLYEMRRPMRAHV